MWPDDYSARIGAQGIVEVIDAEGQVVLREGDRFHAGGGYGEGQLPGACALRHPDYVVVGTAVKRLEPI